MNDAKQFPKHKFYFLARLVSRQNERKLI